MKTEKDLKLSPAGVAPIRRPRRNQTQLVLPKQAAEPADVQRVIVDWLVPALVEKFLQSVGETEVNDRDRTSGVVGRGGKAIQAQTPC